MDQLDYENNFAWPFAILSVKQLGQFVMPETCGNCLDFVNNCIEYAHQTHEIYHVLPDTIDFKAQELWIHWVKQYLVNVVKCGIKDL